MRFMMVDLFENMYSYPQLYFNNANNLFWGKMIRLSVRFMANIIIPIYYYFTFNNSNSKIVDNQEDFIVSVTTYPDRINKVWLVIESIMRQTVKPSKIVLWLSREQFEGMSTLPKRLLKQRVKGLDIRFVDDNLRSHKKYYYAFKEFKNHKIITVDDDTFYSENLFSELINLNRLFPNAICCTNGRVIEYEKSELRPYKYWTRVNGLIEPTFQIIPIGIGGILYPPNCLNEEVFNIRAIKENCFYADDLWLNVMARINGTKSAKLEKTISNLPIINFKSSSLSKINNGEGQNDLQLNNIINYCQVKFGINPYSIK
jgi:hypothetical protein